MSEYQHWQLCPKCNGNGTVYGPFLALGGNVSTSAVCDVCKGQKIISIITGLPPGNIQPAKEEQP